MLAAVEPEFGGTIDSCEVVGAKGLFGSDYGAAQEDCSCQASEMASQVAGSSSRDDGLDDGQCVVAIDLEVFAYSATAYQGPQEYHEYLHE